MQQNMSKGQQAIERWQQLRRERAVKRFNDNQWTESEFDILNKPRGWLNNLIVDRQCAFMYLNCKAGDNIYVESSQVAMNISQQTVSEQWADDSGIDFCQGSVDLVLFPANIRNTHWVLIVANLTRNVIAVLDPFQNDEYIRYAATIAGKIARKINTVREKRQCKTGEMTVGRLNNIPKQNNNHDCGLFVLKYISDLLARKAIYKHHFNAGPMRKRMHDQEDWKGITNPTINASGKIEAAAQGSKSKSKKRQ